MALHRLAATWGASTHSCSLSHFLASLRVLIFPSLTATKYSSSSTSRRRYLNRLKAFFSASAGSMSSVKVIPQSSSFSKKRSRLKGFPSYEGGLMSFRSSHTAASAALETMNVGHEDNLGSHHRPPWVPTAATCISSRMSTRWRRGSSTYAAPRCPRRTPSMCASSSWCRRLQATASRRSPRAGVIP